MVELVDPPPENESPDEEEPPRVFFFISAGLAIGGILRAVIKFLNCPIPFRVLILFVGSIVGFLSGAISHMEKYTEVVHVKPRFILMAFLPVLVFKTAFCIDAHTFMRSWCQIFLLAVPGLLMSACFTGMIMMVILGHDDWTYAMGILFGTICSAIYPVEIVSMLKEIGQAKHLSILLEGEGLIGDTTVIIMYEILLGVIDERITTWYHVMMVFLRFAIGGIALGLIAGKLMSWIMGAMYNDVVNMLISTIVAAYLTYYIGVEILSVSGVLAVVVLGIMSSMEKTSLSVDVEIFLLYFWDMLAYTANSIVFLLAGVIIAERLLQYTTLQDYTLVLVTYVVAGVARLITYIAMAPIVSRIGYGLTFRNMTIAVWSGLRGPVPFCLTLSVFHHIGLSPLGRELLVHIAGLVTLTLLINATTMPLLLRLLGLSELSMARKVNMNNCMRHLQNRRDRTISMLKMDRFLADANWPLVNTATILKHPYKINFTDSDDEEDNYLGFRVTTCPDCLKEIPNEPTSKEMAEMTREARMRILKAKKISYARQYENGMLSKDAIRVLTQAVEMAMDTPDAIIELEGLHKLFKRQGFLHYTRRKLLAIFFKKTENTVKPPRKYWRRICYHIIMHPAFDLFIYACITLNVIPIGLEMGLMPKSGSNLSTGIKAANTIFFLIYLVEFLLKIYGFSWIYVCRHGFKTYFRSYWNIFDFTILCVAFIDLIMDYVDMFSGQFNKVNHKASRVTLATKLIRVIRLIRLLRLCKAWYPRLIKYCDSKIDKHLAFAYDVGKGFVTGEEEVSDMLIQMIDNKTIREDCRLRMEADRLAVTKELGLVQKDRPWIAITVKTRQAIRATLNSMGEAILELKVSGWVDDVEYAMLMETLEERLKYVRTKVTAVQPSPPKVMFKEVPWMADDEQISDFLYENVVTKVFDQGDVVCVDGEKADGVYIIVTGLFKLSYMPKKEVLDSLAEYGALPIIDYIACTRFDEKVEDYIVSGNCVGELSALTGRPYNCTITADTASQAYILTHDVIKQAIQRSPDPVNGLESKMWKSISIRLATSILMDTPAYQSSTQEKIRFQLERAFVPNLSNYKVFGVNDMMEDIMLIEGVVFDYNTRDCYTAPCYIPRTVQRIVLPKSSHMDFETTVETKLLIIPARDVDEFDIMEREEEISEMVSTASVKCLQHVIQNRVSRLRKKRKRQTTFSMGGRRVKYGGSHTSASHSLTYSRSRITNASSVETELQDINMNGRGSSSNVQNSYILNEKENKPSTYDRKLSRGAPSAGERRLSSRHASSVSSKRPLRDSTNRDDDRRFSKIKERQANAAYGENDQQSKSEESSVTEEQKGVRKKSKDAEDGLAAAEQKGAKKNSKDTEDGMVLEEQKRAKKNSKDIEYGLVPEENKGEQKKSDDRSFLNKQQENEYNFDISQRKQSGSSKKSVQLSNRATDEDEDFAQKFKKSEQLSEKQKDSSEFRENDENPNNKTEKENYRTPADAKSLNQRDASKDPNPTSERRPTKTLDDLTQNKRHSNNLKKSGDSGSQKERQISDEIELIEVEQKSQIFTSTPEDKLYKSKENENLAVDKKEKLFNDVDKSQRRQSDSNKASNDYSRRSEDVKEKDQRKNENQTSSSKPATAENYDGMKERTKTDETTEYLKPESSSYKTERRQSETRYNAERKSDDRSQSQNLQEQTITPEKNNASRRKSAFEYSKFESFDDDSKLSESSRSANKKLDYRTHLQRPEEQPILPKAKSAPRRKSDIEYPKSDNFDDDSKLSETSRSADKKPDYRTQLQRPEEQPIVPDIKSAPRRKSVMEYPKSENFDDDSKVSETSRSADRKPDYRTQQHPQEQPIAPETKDAPRRTATEYPTAESSNYQGRRKQHDDNTDNQSQSQNLETPYVRRESTQSSLTTLRGKSVRPDVKQLKKSAKPEEEMEVENLRGTGRKPRKSIITSSADKTNDEQQSGYDTEKRRKSEGSRQQDYKDTKDTEKDVSRQSKSSKVSDSINSEKEIEESSRKKRRSSSDDDEA